MKKKEKQGLLILVGVAILIITVIWFATRPAKEDNGQTTGTQSSAAQGEFTKVEADGSIVNTSEKLNADKKESGFDITNISFGEKNGKTILKARVTNKTGKPQGEFLAKIVLLNKQGKEIGRIPVRLPDMKVGEAIDVQATITESYANAYDFRLEK